MLDRLQHLSPALDSALSAVYGNPRRQPTQAIQQSWREPRPSASMRKLESRPSGMRPTGFLRPLPVLSDWPGHAVPQSPPRHDALSRMLRAASTPFGACGSSYSPVAGITFLYVSPPHHPKSFRLRVHRPPPYSGPDDLPCPLDRLMQPRLFISANVCHFMPSPRPSGSPSSAPRPAFDFHSIATAALLPSLSCLWSIFLATDVRLANYGEWNVVIRESECVGVTFRQRLTRLPRGRRLRLEEERTASTS